jgi:hypothetical protein
MTAIPFLIRRHPVSDYCHSGESDGSGVRFQTAMTPVTAMVPPTHIKNKIYYILKKIVFYTWQTPRMAVMGVMEQPALQLT